MIDIINPAPKNSLEEFSRWMNHQQTLWATSSLLGGRKIPVKDISEAERQHLISIGEYFDFEADEGEGL